MNLNWSKAVIRYVLFVFNLLFVISGIILVAVGASVKTYYTDYDIFLNNSYFSLPNLLIATGSLIFFISFVGCYGTIRESGLMIFIFLGLLVLIFILELSAGIAGYVLRDKTTSYLTDALTESMKQYQAQIFVPATTTSTATTSPIPSNPTTKPPDTTTKPPDTTTKPPDTTTKSPDTTRVPLDTTTKHSNLTTLPPTTTPEDDSKGDSEPRAKRTARLRTNAITTLWDKIQPEFKCCGVKGAADWNTVLGTDLLPSSCCYTYSGVVGHSTCSMSINITSAYYKTGCVTGFGQYLKDHAVTLGGVGLAIAIIQLFGIILVYLLAKQLRQGVTVHEGPNAIIS